MKFLITNDDGIHAESIIKLARFLSGKGHCVTVVAPKNEMSAVSHAITMHDPIRIKKIFLKEAFPCYSINGTPVDCIKMALEIIMETKPDWIISGMNRGLNLGTDIFYSGTLSAAMEGWFNGIPAIAISAPESFNKDFDPLYEFFNKAILMPLIRTQRKGLFNVNFPDSEVFKGVKVTELGRLKYVNIYKKRTDPRGNTYYWLAGDIEDSEINNHSTDVRAIENGFVSLTPINIDMTDYESIAELNILLS
ncbi:MAG: 5'/3'-nucleotidase SurE [Peptostreptococcaceae bacterium]|nr:5'/3'-nucleotidase SurE [Peptostreptococcaceae bacterium]